MKSYSNERERLLLGVNKESIGTPGIKNPVLPFTPGEGMQHFPNTFQKKGKRFRGWWNILKNTIPILKIRLFQ